MGWKQVEPGGTQPILYLQKLRALKNTENGILRRAY